MSTGGDVYFVRVLFLWKEINDYTWLCYFGVLWDVFDLVALHEKKLLSAFRFPFIVSLY